MLAGKKARLNSEKYVAAYLADICVGIEIVRSAEDERHPTHLENYWTICKHDSTRTTRTRIAIKK
jgi:hypothetical protein